MATAVRSILSPAERPRFLEELKRSYQKAVQAHEKAQALRELVPLATARKNRFKLDCAPVPRPRFVGVLTLNNYPIKQVMPYIDWNGFLSAWDMTRNGKGREEQEAALQGASFQQQELLADAKAMLSRVEKEGLLTLRGALGLFQAQAEDEDIIVYPIGAPPVRFHFLRNQTKTASANPCLSDFIVPDETGTAWMGFFALGAGFGLKTSMAAMNDDYERLLLASLANSLAEALSEEVHLNVRRTFWAYAPNENLSVTDILAGKYAGIRPAFGYPSCPVHSDKRACFDLLDAENRTGIRLTESFMMDPAASVCGMYFAHPNAWYFAVGAVG
jgi:5-methyltetrahydrofolate--homocysteine methyltransferase